jgi:hypothetical protein
LVWKKADTILEKAVAFGFVSHNGITGADATAHGNYAYDAPVGWVIAKAVELHSAISMIAGQLRKMGRGKPQACRASFFLRILNMSQWFGKIEANAIWNSQLAHTVP